MEDKKIVSQFIQDAMKCSEWEVIHQPIWIHHLADWMMREDWVRMFDYPIEDVCKEIESKRPDCDTCQSPVVSIDICNRCVWNIIFTGKTDRFVNDGKPVLCECGHDDFRLNYPGMPVCNKCGKERNHRGPKAHFTRPPNPSPAVNPVCQGQRLRTGGGVDGETNMRLYKISLVNNVNKIYVLAKDLNSAEQKVKDSFATRKYKDPTVANIEVLAETGAMGKLSILLE